MQVGNIDPEVVAGFGDEWTRFDHKSSVSVAELGRIFDEYFDVFPWHLISSESIGFDMGCGSGRWAKFVAPRVGELHLIDASFKALKVAESNLAGMDNCRFHHASVDAIPLADKSCDFGYSLGVLHHIPDPEAGLRSCVAKLKPGAPFLVYLYYAFDNRPAWYRWIWKFTDVLREIICRLPSSARYGLSQVIAAVVYFPLARTARLVERMGMNVDSFPLSQYRDRRFYVMRTDALDRFGTRLERRFTRDQVLGMMTRVGLKDIAFSKSAFWTAVGIKR